MATFHFGESSKALKRLEADRTLKPPVKVRLQTLRLNASFLDAILSCLEKNSTDDKGFHAFMRKAENVDKQLQRILFIFNQVSSREGLIIPENLHPLISSAAEKFELIRPNVQQFYSQISKSTLISCRLYASVEHCMDSLVENLRDLVICKAESVVYLKREIQALEANLVFLRNQFCFAKYYCIENEKLKDLLTHSKRVIASTACLLYLCSVNSMIDGQMVIEMKVEISGQIQKIDPLQPGVRKIYIKSLNASKPSAKEDNDLVIRFRDLDIKFLDSLLGMTETSIKTTWIMSLNDLIEALNQELRILRDFLIDPSSMRKSEANNLMLPVKDLIWEAACVIHSFYESDICEDMMKEMSLPVVDLLERIKIIKHQARHVYEVSLSESWMPYFPRTKELVHVDSIMGNLEELLNFRGESFAALKHQFEIVHLELLSLRKDLIEISKQDRANEKQKDLWTSFKEIAHKTGVLVDSLMMGHLETELWYYKWGLLAIIEDIRPVRREVNGIKAKKTDDTAVIKFSRTLDPAESQVRSVEVGSWLGEVELMPTPNHESRVKDSIIYIELFDDEAEKIKDQLIYGLENLHIVSIVGMPGIGKTTLADSMYESPSSLLHFHVRARCCVTQAYNKRKLLLDILHQVSEETEQGHEMNEDDLALKLRQRLKSKKYLIFIDDLWDILSWNDLSVSFPDDNNGSRILLTSRFHNLASQIGHMSTTYPLNPLSNTKSWELLQAKIFVNESLPEKLWQIGERIAASCKGLPLALDLVAGLLRMRDTREDCWEEVASNIRTHLLEDQQGRCRTILELSYNHLPNHLKLCFLYVAGFPEDNEVLVCKLIRLWIAEGFIQPQNASQALDDVARESLNDLIARSLVTNSRERSLGGAKAIRVHDIIHEFASAKAKEEHFLHKIAGNNQFLPLSGHHLFINTEWEKFAKANPTAVTFRSLVFSGSSSLFSCHDVSVISKSFKLLRVLDLANINSFYCPGIFSLIHLRFLALKSNRTHPISIRIANLLNIETFHLDGFRIREILLETLLKLSRLRHFNTSSCYSLQYGDLKIFEQCSQLHNLQTLSTPCLSYGEDTEKIMRKLPNLQKLTCIFSDSWDHSLNCNFFPSLEFLTQLESLKVFYKGDVLYPCKFSFPSNLKKLTLSEFCLPWTEISTIGKLPNLQVLKLLNKAFEGKLWEMGEGEFPKLKFLKLDSLNIAQWNLSEDSLPPIEQLVLRNCRQLEELPSCLCDIPTLKKLELRFCNGSIVASARRIAQAQEEWGNEELKIIIDPQSPEEYWHAMAESIPAFDHKFRALPSFD